MEYLKTKHRPPRIVVLAAQGRCVRDWFLSNFLPALTTQAEVIVFSPQAELLRQHLNQPRVSFERMEAKPLGTIQRNSAMAIEFAHFYRQQTYIHKSILSRSLYGWPRKSRLRVNVLKGAARYLLRRFSTDSLELLERMSLGLMAESKRIEGVFRRLQIDLVFSTLPLIAHYERPALWAAQRLGIPTVCVITSWDNLFSKGRLPVHFSHHMVWSERMKEDLCAHYPDIKPTAITVIGAAQFDFYRHRELLKDRVEFLCSIGGDPSRKLILWSGSSVNQMPNEPAVAELFCEAIRSERVHGSPQILIRPHPIGGGANFAQLRKRYPEVLFTETNSTDTQFLIRWLPLLEDSILLVNSVAHCDVNINHCSTMTLDSCVLNRPVVNIAFDLVSGSEMEEYVRNCYLYDHYRSVLDLGAVRMAYSLDELITQVNAYLENPELDKEGRARLLKLQCGGVDGKAVERAAECLLGLVNAQPEKVLAVGEK